FWLKTMPSSGSVLDGRQQVDGKFALSRAISAVSPRCPESSWRKITDISLLAGKKTVDRFALDCVHRQLKIKAAFLV
ncbi:MAG: hypothetical protein V4730_10705, partial [Pseudomonadota bacterium]